METASDLKARWTVEHTQRINSALASGAIAAGMVAMVELGGLVRFDLRGMRITEMLRTVSIDRVDFSHSAVEGAGQFIDVTCLDCLFHAATLDTNLGTRFVRCDFSRARLNVLRGHFEDCSFQSANLTGALGKSIEFIRCDFTAANLRKANLYECLFERCRWGTNKFRSGSLAGSRFLGDCPSTLDLGNTIMDDVSVVSPPA